MSLSRSCARLIGHMRPAIRPNLQSPVAYSPTLRCSAPLSLAPIRHYDRKRYLKEKKKLKAQQNQEDISFAESFGVFKTYCLGEDKTVKAHIQVPKHEEGHRPLRGEVLLPHQVSAEDNSVILVFAKGEHAEEAKRRGAHIVGAEDLIQDILADKVKFDKVLSTKEMFPQVVKIARVLGPKGLMPSPAKGTVSDDIATMMSSLKAVTKFEVDGDGSIHIDVGKASWREQDVFENLHAVVGAILKVRPSKTDANKFLESVSISADHTPGMKLPMKPFKVAKAAKAPST